MKAEWNEYLSEIQLPSSLYSIIERKIKDVQDIFGVGIDKIFVTNRRTEQGIDFVSIWLFSNGKAFECKNFVSTDDYDIVITRKNISYVSIQKSNYSDINNPSTDSSLSSSCYLANTSLSCSFNAVGVNCKYLMRLLQDEFISNVVPQ